MHLNNLYRSTRQEYSICKPSPSPSPAPCGKKTPDSTRPLAPPTSAPPSNGRTGEFVVSRLPDSRGTASSPARNQPSGRSPHRRLRRPRPTFGRRRSADFRLFSCPAGRPCECLRDGLYRPVAITSAVTRKSGYLKLGENTVKKLECTYCR